MVKAFIFDFRGTVVNTEPAKTACVDFLYNFVTSKGASVSLDFFKQRWESSHLHVLEKLSANKRVFNWNLIIVKSLFDSFSIKVEGEELQHLMERFDAVFVEKTEV